MQRPTSVTVIAVLGIIFGTLSLCGLVFQLMGNAMSGMGGGAEGPGVEFQKALQENEAMQRYSNLGMIAGFILVPLLFAGSIGSLMLKAWGRTAMLIYAVVSILNTLVSTAMYLMVVNPSIQEVMKQYTDEQSQQIANMTALFMSIALGCGVLIGLIYPIATLIVMSNPRVKQAFEGTGGSSYPSE